MITTEPYITGVLVERTETSARPVALNFRVTFEYANREPVTINTNDARWLDDALGELGVPGPAATHILQRGGYVARVQPATALPEPAMEPTNIRNTRTGMVHHQDRWNRTMCQHVIFPRSVEMTADAVTCPTCLDRHGVRLEITYRHAFGTVDITATVTAESTSDKSVREALAREVGPECRISRLMGVRVLGRKTETNSAE